VPGQSPGLELTKRLTPRLTVAAHASVTPFGLGAPRRIVDQQWVGMDGSSKRDGRAFADIQLVRHLLLHLGGEAMNDDLVRAIADKRLIEFVYKVGRTRIVEPHDYGVKGGIECLLGYQISGESHSGVPHGWKQFDLDQIRQLRVLERRFAGTRADDAQRHRAWETLFARVT
jgi:hypothetical protein